MKILVDTNVLISAVFRNKLPEKVVMWIATQVREPAKGRRKKPHESKDRYQERDAMPMLMRDNRGDYRSVQDLGDQQPHGAVHHRGATCRQGSYGIAGRRNGWPSDRAYCFLSRDHFGRHTELVRTWTCFRVAGAPAEGHWQSPDTRRVVTSERL